MCNKGRKKEGKKGGREEGRKEEGKRGGENEGWILTTMISC